MYIYILHIYIYVYIYLYKPIYIYIYMCFSVVHTRLPIHVSTRPTYVSSAWIGMLPRRETR